VLWQNITVANVWREDITLYIRIGLIKMWSPWEMGLEYKLYWTVWHEQSKRNGCNVQEKGIRLLPVEDALTPRNGPWVRAGITQRYSAGLQAGWLRVPAGAGNFSVHHRVQTGSGAQPGSYPMSERVSFSGVKRPERKADHSPPSRMRGAIPLLPHYAFMVWCSVK
jgi:hypothetical protein